MTLQLMLTLLALASQEPARAPGADRPVELVALLDAWGASGSMQHDKTWTLSVDAIHWRRPGEKGDASLLRLTRPGLTHDELRAEMARLPANAIVRLRVVFEKERAQGARPAVARLVEYVGAEHDDAELTAILRERLRPIVIEDAVLGSLTLKRRSNAYEGSRKIRGAPYRLGIYRNGANDDLDRDRGLIASRRAVVERSEQAVDRYAAAAAAKLLDLYNDQWRDERGPLLDRGAFVRRLRLDSITVYEDGSAEIIFNDGGLFSGHAIVVNVKADGTVSGATISG